MAWLQREIQLPSFPKGCHPISQPILEALPELAKINIGLLHIFIKHTSASLTINEKRRPGRAGRSGPRHGHRRG